MIQCANGQVLGELEDGSHASEESRLQGVRCRYRLMKMMGILLLSFPWERNFERNLDKTESQQALTTLKHISICLENCKSGFPRYEVQYGCSSRFPSPLHAGSRGQLLLSPRRSPADTGRCAAAP